ncbi:MAG: MYXO-CTERM sorting domain-containing protein [Polyangiales bacterium]
MPPPASSAAPVPSVEPKPGGCGCTVPGSAASIGFPTAIAIALAALGRRKRS